jgi:hypothetical protein
VGFGFGVGFGGTGVGFGFGGVGFGGTGVGLGPLQTAWHFVFVGYKPEELEALMHWALVEPLFWQL